MHVLLDALLSYPFSVVNLNLRQLPSICRHGGVFFAYYVLPEFESVCATCRMLGSDLWEKRMERARRPLLTFERSSMFSVDSSISPWRRRSINRYKLQH